MGEDGKSSRLQRPQRKLCFALQTQVLGANSAERNFCAARVSTDGISRHLFESAHDFGGSWLKPPSMFCAEFSKSEGRRSRRFWTIHPEPILTHADKL
jgi:hypothetical protein